MDRKPVLQKPTKGVKKVRARSEIDENTALNQIQGENEAKKPSKDSKVIMMPRYTTFGENSASDAEPSKEAAKPKEDKKVKKKKTKVRKESKVSKKYMR